jgi:phosphoglycolate phosphatase-like HAD superfamily hydrolase
MADPSLSIRLDLDGAPADSRPGGAGSCAAALRALGHGDAGSDACAFIGASLEAAMAAAPAPF